MTTVISDTSPVNYLCLIGAIDILPRLFDSVIIPPTVLLELQHSKAPAAVSSWLQQWPAWLKLQAPANLLDGLDLDAGESEAISLALELKLPIILLDDRSARKAAETRGLTPVGTLNILYSAHQHGILDFEIAMARLRATNFHIDHTIVESLIESVRKGNNIP